MTGPDPPARLSMADALRHWCDAPLVRAVMAAESKYSEIRTHRLGHPNIGGARPADEEGSAFASSTLPRDHEAYMFAWNALIADFRRRLVEGEIFLLGVQTHPEPETARRPIPGVWAAEYEIDWETGGLSVAGRRYVAVVCTRTPPAEPAAAPVDGSRGKAPITAESVRALTNDEVLLLLEEHARRVISGPDARLIAPGKISLLPIVAGKMRDRAERGELLPSQAAEVHWLYEWVKSKVDLHHVPTVATIKRVLGKQYEALKGRSNREIQKV